MANWEKIKVVRKKENMQIGEIKPEKHYKVLNVNKSGGLEVDYSITFRITEACDLKCNYCHWHSGAHYKYEDIITSIDKLFLFFEKQKFKKVLFYYHGGEATRHPKIVEILKYVHDKSKETGIIAYNEMQTNLTIKKEKLLEILKYCDSFNVSYHYLELKEKNKLKDFDDNYNTLKSMNVELHNFDVMLENINETDIDNFYSTVLKYLEYDRILNSEMIYGFCHYKYPENIAEKHMNFYKEHNKTEQKYMIDDVVYNTNDLFQKGIDARGWHCAAGTESITINGDGNVFHCGIHMTNYIRECIPEVPFTNLVHDNMSIIKMSVLYNTGTKCRWDYCGGDFYLSREKR